MFIPFESVNLFIYTMESLIFPIKYYRNSVKSIQRNFPNHILISKNRWVENSNISFEVEVDKSKLIKLDDNFFLYPEPFTFSKVKKIFFKNREQMETTITNIEISTTYFPKQLLEIDESPSVKFDIQKHKYKNRNFQNQINLFSKYLGLFAINRIFLKQDIQYVSQRYKAIEKIVIKRNIENSDIEKYAEKENIKLEKFLHFYKLDNLPTDSLTYILIILQKYRYKMNDNLAGLIEETKHLDNNLQKTFLLLYGLMLGYQNLPFLGIDTKFRFEKKEDFQILDDVYKIAFRKRIKKADRLEQLKTDIFEKNFDEILDKFGVSETTLKPNIRQTILEFDISVSEKIELFEKFGLRVSKNLSILKLKEILKNGKFTSKELAEKLKVSLNTIRNYLKEISLQI